MKRTATFKLTPEQYEIANDPSRIRVLIATRRYGKSMLLTAMHSKVGCSKPGFSVTLNPLQSQSEKLYKQNIDAVPAVKRLFAKEPKVWPWPKINFRGTNHEWELRAFERNPNALLGGQLDFASFDESADFDSDDALRVIFPRTADKRAPIFITGTVTTQNSFLWRYYIKGQATLDGRPNPDKDPNVRSWLYDYTHAVVFQGPGGEEELKFQRSQVSSWVFDQQFRCIPASDGATAFKYLSECLIADDAVDEQGNLLSPTKPQDGRRYLAALDIGRAVNQGFITVIDDRGVVVEAQAFPLGLKHEIYAQMAASTARFWNAKMIADATGGGGSGGEKTSADSYILLYKKEFPLLKEFFFSPNARDRNKYELVTSLQLQTEQAKIRIPRRHKMLIDQLGNYRILVGPTGLITFGPVTGQDDGVASLLMSAWQYKQGKVARGMTDFA